MTRRANPMARQDRIQSAANALARPEVQAAVVRAETDDSEPAGTSAELWLYGVVGGFWSGFNSHSVAAALRSLESVDKILVRLHSPGGIAMEGIAIANLLRNHPATIMVVVDGLAASAASMIALAGDEVVMSPGAQVMIHDPWMLTVGNAAQLKSDAEWLDKQADNYAETYAYAAGGTADQWRQVMTADNGEGTWYSAQGAVDAGLANRVGTITSTTPPPAPPEDDLDDDEAEARAALDLELMVHPSARAAWNDSTQRPPAASADGSTPTGRSSAVAFSDEQMNTLRNQLGVAEDADEATILAALDEALEERAETEPQSNTTTSPEVPEGMTLVETEVFDTLRDGAQAGVEAREQQRGEERDRAITAAITAGKTTPARREHWQTAWDADPEGTRQILDKLPSGLVPVEELGDAGAPEASADDALYDRLYPTEKGA